MAGPPSASAMRADPLAASPSPSSVSSFSAIPRVRKSIVPDMAAASETGRPAMSAGASVTSSAVSAKRAAGAPSAAR